MLVQFNNLFTVFASSMNCTVCIDPPVAVVSRVATGPDFQARARLHKPGPGPARSNLKNLGSSPARARSNDMPYLTKKIKITAHSFINAFNELDQNLSKCASHAEEISSIALTCLALS